MNAVFVEFWESTELIVSTPDDIIDELDVPGEVECEEIIC